ncbi:autotransporter outer membrane beta-barrel domain-containing protein, partial [Roseobacter sp. HKCCD9042]|uniref:autotransporter outer membrane beta-barrel domain-containing protein n=1 Tax=Roseobacter sp. HKCCD9042 TaxID=2690635 RepID=UPI0014931BFC
MTKFKGRVASIAPGLSVVATAAVLFSGVAAQAGCSGISTITCDGATPYTNGITYHVGSDGLTLNLNNADVTNDGFGVFAKTTAENGADIAVQMESGRIATTSANAMAIFSEIGVAGSDANVTVNVKDGATITTSDRQAHGVLASNKGSGNAHVVMEGEETKITTSGANVRGADGAILDGNSYGLWANISQVNGEGGWGNATAEMEGGTITMNNGSQAYAVYAQISNQDSDATATAIMRGGDIITDGHRAYGMFVQTNGTGLAIAEMSGGTITTNVRSDEATAAVLGFMPNNTYGIWAYIEANATIDADKAVALAKMSGGEILTKSNNGYGIVASSNGSGTAKVEVTGNSKVTTEGKNAHAVFAWSYNRGNKTATAVVGNTADIETSGEGAHGVSAIHTVYGAAEVYMYNGKVETRGKEAHGLNAFSAAATASVHLGGSSTVEASGEDADGIRAESATDFDIRVDGSVTGGIGNAAAIRTISRSGLPGVKGEIRIAGSADVNGEASGLAIEDGDGDTTITSRGTITGDILLGAGDDTLTLRSVGSFTGDIYAGEGNDTVTIETLTLDEGRYILDGGVGGNDELTFIGPPDAPDVPLEGRIYGPIVMTATETHLRNWERVEVDKDMEIDSESEFHVFGGESDTPTVLTIAGDVTNNDGSVVLSVQNGNTGDEIKIEGNYTGSDTGSDVFALDMGRDADGVNTDTVVITGNTSGEMTLLIAGLDSAGVEGAPLVMDVVTVGGGEANGTFTLVGGNYVTSEGEQAMISGAYLYRLAETDRGWALSARSESGEINWGPSAPIYDSYGAALLAFNGPSALRGRGSSQDFRSLAWGGDAAGQDTGAPLWIQMGTEQLTSAAEQSTTGAARDSSLWEMEIGADLVLSESAAGLFVGGLMLSYGTGSTDVSSGFGDGSIETTGLGVGLSATWYDTRGFYVDGQVTVTSYSSDL